MIDPSTGPLFLTFSVCAAVLVILLWILILRAIIKSAVLAALRKHTDETQTTSTSRAEQQPY